MTKVFKNDMPVAENTVTFFKRFNFSSEKRVGVEMKIELECWYLKNRATRQRDIK